MSGQLITELFLPGDEFGVNIGPVWIGTESDGSGINGEKGGRAIAGNKLCEGSLWDLGGI